MHKRPHLGGFRNVPDAGNDPQRVQGVPRQRQAHRAGSLLGEPAIGPIGDGRRCLLDGPPVVVPAFLQGDPMADQAPAEPTDRVAQGTATEPFEAGESVVDAGLPVAGEPGGQRAQGCPGGPSPRDHPIRLTALSAVARASRNLVRSTSRWHQAVCTSEAAFAPVTSGGIRWRIRSIAAGAAAVEAAHGKGRQQAERLSRLACLEPVLDRRHARRPCSRTTGPRGCAAPAVARATAAPVRRAAPHAPGCAPRTTHPSRSR